MGNVRVNIDRAALERAVRTSPGWKKLQDDLNERMRDAISQVRTTHTGRSRADVGAALRERFGVLGIQPSEPGFSQAVDEISGEHGDD